MQENLHVGIVFPEYHHALNGQISWGTNFSACQVAAGKIGLSVTETELALFPAGSMFWAKKAAISKLFEANFLYSDFPEERRQVDGTLAHAIERLFGEVVTSAGYDILQVKSTIPHDLIFYHTRANLYKEKSLEYYDRIRKLYSNSAAAKKEIVVYTALSGGYDLPLLYEKLDPEIDYVLFTDGPTPNCGFWQVRAMDYWHPEFVRMARYVKTHPHKYFSDYKFAVWVDANVLIRGEIKKYVDLFRKTSEAVFGGIRHPKRECIYEEAFAVVEARKDLSGRVAKQVEFYRRAGYPINAGLIETNLLIMDLRNPNLRRVMNDWWAQIEEFSHRDQLSINYVLWKNRLEWVPLMAESQSLRDSLDFAMFGHGAESGYALSNPRLRGLVVDPYLSSRSQYAQSDAQPAPPNKAVDVVVCVHNALLELKACLRSVLGSMRPTDRLIVVDDASDDETAKFLRDIKDRHGSITLLAHRGSPRGYCVSANEGLRACTASYILLLNSDTVLCRKALEKMVLVAESNPTIGIVGPMSNAASTQSIPYIRGSQNQTAINTLPSALTTQDLDALCAEWSLQDILPSVPLVHGFCQLIRKDFFEEIGWFDEDAFPFGYGEENDFCFRATNAGFDLKIATNAYVHHVKSASYKDDARRGELMRQGTIKLKEKHSEDRLGRAVQAMEGNPLLIRMRRQAETYLAKLNVSKS